MFRYLPSKKVFFVAAAAVGVLVLTIFYQSSAKQTKFSEEKTLLSTIVYAAESFPDSDKDGLYDWEEELYGTDPNDSDTNKNGILDGEEYETEKEALQIENSDSLYSAIKNLGDKFQNAPNPIEALSSEPIFYDDVYYERNINKTESTKETNSEYVVNAILILSKNTLALENEPLETIKRWLETYSQKELDELQKVAEENVSTANALMEITVPTDFIEIHLQIVNNLYKSALSLRDVQATTLDPTAGFFAAANYANYQSKYIDGVFKLADQNANNE